jgi:hypothetical protein
MNSMLWHWVKHKKDSYGKSSGLRTGAFRACQKTADRDCRALICIEKLLGRVYHTIQRVGLAIM